MLSRRLAGTAETRYRGAKAFFDWLVEEGEIHGLADGPRQAAADLGEVPPPILSDDELRLPDWRRRRQDFDERRELPSSACSSTPA